MAGIMSGTIVIRAEQPTDVDAITALTRAAFIEAPHTSHTEHFIVNALRRAGQLSISLVAEQAGTVIGHVAFSPVTLSNGASDWYGLAPVSVAPAFQGRGIGSLLIQEGLGMLREKGAAGCVLLGDPAYYYRFGFRAIATLVLPDVPPEYFQALPFKELPLKKLAFGKETPSVTVAFHDAFNATS